MKLMTLEKRLPHQAGDVGQRQTTCSVVWDSGLSIQYQNKKREKTKKKEEREESRKGERENKERRKEEGRGEGREGPESCLAFLSCGSVARVRSHLWGGSPHQISILPTLPGL